MKLIDLINVINVDENCVLTNTKYYPKDNEIYFLGDFNDIPSKFNNFKVLQIVYHEKEFLIYIKDIE